MVGEQVLMSYVGSFGSRSGAHAIIRNGLIQCLAMLALLAAEVAPQQEFPMVRCDQVCRWLAGRQVACLGGRYAGRLAAWQAGKQAG